MAGLVARHSPAASFQKSRRLSTPQGTPLYWTPLGLFFAQVPAGIWAGYSVSLAPAA